MKKWREIKVVGWRAWCDDGAGGYSILDSKNWLLGELPGVICIVLYLDEHDEQSGVQHKKFLGNGDWYAMRRDGKHVTDWYVTDSHATWGRWLKKPKADMTARGVVVAADVYDHCLTECGAAPWDFYS